MNNPFSDAPRQQGGQNPFLGVLDGLVRQIEQGQISAQAEREMIDAAAFYARRNHLSFTPTLQGVVKMAADADRMHRLHMDALEARQRAEFDPELTGYDRDTGFEA
jgi:hypothetical protein